MWRITFPGRDGIASAADALALVATYGGRLPPSIEDRATLPTNLSGFVVVVIRFSASAAQAA